MISKMVKWIGFWIISKSETSIIENSEQYFISILDETLTESFENFYWHAGKGFFL